MWSKEYSLDDLGQIVQESIAQQHGLSAQTDYQYDGLGRITQLSDGENTQGFDYDKVGRLVQQRQYHLNANGMVESQALHYHYDKNGNRTKLILPNKDEIHSLYYGSGHLSAIKYNDSLITEISRGKLHQELTRTQGKLTTQFKRDPLGRLAQQLAVLSDVNQLTSGQIVERIYQYDNVGNLIQTQDKRFGTTNYRYDKLGQIQLAGQELFRFDPAHNIIEREQQKITDNRVTTYQGITYRYDEFGNLQARRLPTGEVQHYQYNLKDQLIEVRIEKPNQTSEVWQYQYDVLGRRISKRLENQDNLQEFIWDGSHLVQEIDHKTNRTYCYIYTHPSSYEPLAQLVFAKNSKNPTACYYYHNDQIGVPRELTDEKGKLCWYGDYTGWGKLKDEYALVENIHQPFRLQNQYCDSETGLHYNFFRYYEPNVGRFTQLDPIGLAGGENLYEFAPNINGWEDSLGLRGNTLRTNHNRNINNTYSGGAVNRSKVIYKQPRNIGRLSPIPTKIRGGTVPLMRTNSSQVEMFEYIGGEIKDKLIDFANLSPTTGVAIYPQNKGVGVCEKTKYECILQKRMDDKNCPAKEFFGVEECYSEEYFYSDSQYHFVPTGTSVECKEIK